MESLVYGAAKKVDPSQLEISMSFYGGRLILFSISQDLKQLCNNEFTINDTQSFSADIKNIPPS